MGTLNYRPLNYRPVSLTSIVCKICQVIKEQWTEYLEREGIISDRQIWIQNRKIMCHKLIKLSFKNNRHETWRWTWTRKMDGWITYI